MRRSLWWVLHTCTAVFLSTLVMLTAQSWHRQEHHFADASDAGAERNERSTPRSFVLPATPAVAEEQQLQKAEADNLAEGSMCLKALRSLGYDVSALPPVYSAQNMSEIARFQRARQLELTGRLDRLTRAGLKC
jgi:hypothetical protein